jgi:2-[(L-alanin-3-ylcarbamoyl)methyl]-3-(2-aminoethylcarbamoyl)-2-hydroxypropanoate synthase
MDVQGFSESWIEALHSKHYKQVEQRVVRQLMQSLLYEALLPYHVLDDGGLFVLEGRAPDGTSSHYRCSGQIQHSFGLIKLDQQPVMRVCSDGTARPAGLQDVLTEIVSRIAGAERQGTFSDELEQTLLKDLQAQSLPRPDELSRERVDYDYDELEGDLRDAHAYHPCYKSRIGFSLDDNRIYGPEFKQPLHLSWVAIHRLSSRMNHSARVDHRTFIREELGDEDCERFSAVLHRQGKRIEDYRLIPVHPWQWREHVAAIFHPEIVSRDIIWLGAGSDSYRAQQSIRTLANHSARQKCYVKFALSLTNTSSSRILAAHTVMNGPIITDWLQNLIAQDADARELDFVILGEVLGITYDYERMPESRRSKAYGTFGAIWRESLHRYLRKQEGAVPFNAICHAQYDGRPLINPWIRRHGLLPWTEQLLRVAVTPIIHMLFAHGIGMESHAQNIVLIHQDGWPKRVALKDFHDGVRFSPRHLAQPHRCPELAAVPASHARINRNSFILTDDLRAVRDFSCDSFFFICLAEVAIFLTRHYALAERDFWSMTARVIREYQARHPQHEARFKAFDVFSETFQVEELTKRRLLGDSEPRFREVPNPLHAFRALPC